MEYKELTERSRTMIQAETALGGTNAALRAWDDFKRDIEGQDFPEKLTEPLFLIYVAGMVNVMDPKSEFNSRLRKEIFGFKNHRTGTDEAYQNRNKKQTED